MHLDPRSPFVLDTLELGRRPGQMAHVTRRLVLPEPLGTDVAAIPAGEPIELDLRMESVVEGVLLSGQVSAEAVGACVRCLDQVRIPVDVDFQELFAYADRAAHHHEVGAEDDEDVYELDGDLADLEPVLRDAVVPALPFQPVCRPDCPGLCSECGAHLKDDPDHHHEVLDPRWAALAALASESTDTDENEHEKRN